MTASEPRSHVMRDADQLVATLHQAQISRGPTMRHIAGRLGCARSTVSMRLAGHNIDTLSRWFDLADALGYDLALVPREDAT